MAISTLEIRMTIKTLAAKGQPNRAIARQLGLSESTVRYHRERIATDAVDGRSRQMHCAAGMFAAISHWIEQRGAAQNLAALHDWLVAEFEYPGSLRSVQRYVAATFPPPARRARRRVETPPGAQAQADWAVFPRVIVGGELQTLQAFHLVLSHSRGEAVGWATRQDQMSWLSCHNAAFQRLGGIPAVVRVDNTKTAVVQGAGAWGTINPTYQRYATTVRFHIDACAPYSPEHKGKVERAVRSGRGRFDPAARPWDDLAEWQAATDAAVQTRAQRRICPATGTSVWGAWAAERDRLAPLPRLPEPFDHVVTRRVAGDALVSFEGRQYSVPFAYIGRTVEVRGTARQVQVLADLTLIAEHPRGTPHRLLTNPAHDEGPGTAQVAPPTPLGRMGRRLQEIAAQPVEHRPIDLFAALAEAAR
ncbi:MAG: IS21 family transposase [Pseudomonadota bacterium]